MNKIILSGNLTHNLELKYTSSNKAVLDTSIAVQRPYSNQNGERETDFINIQVWGKQAENLKKYCEKGSKIAIEGELRTSSYEKSDGTRGYKTFVLVNSFEFITTKKKEQNKQQKRDNTSVFEEFGKQVERDIENLPF